MRGGTVAGLVLATACGVFTTYTAFQPELEKHKLEREGKFAEQHQSPEDQDKVISKAIMSDLREAKKEATNSTKGGFAWGIRQALFGPKQQSISDEPGPPAKPSSSQEADRKDNGK